MSKKPRKSLGTAVKESNAATAPRGSQKNAKVHCTECRKVIAAKDQALFVEEEVGRYFCSEGCIVTHFTPDIEKLEREYGKQVSANDLNSEERERYAHLRWTALEKPDEVWLEKTAKGDHRHIVISEYKPEEKTVWAVAICLMLRGDPSFLYLAFVTSDRYLVDVFRKGEKLKIIRKNSLSADPAQTPEKMPAEGEGDRLAEAWTEADSLRAGIIKNRKANDIPIEDFGFYQNCLEETLQEPSELWSDIPKGAKRVYHFIRHYEHDQSFWYVVMAKDTPDETQIEIMDAFPTRDETLVRLCRHGKQEKLGNQSHEGEDALAAGAENLRRNVH